MPYPYYTPFQYGQNLPPQTQQIIPQTQQIQSPFVMVRSEAEARNYPVAFGNVVSFKDENSPFIYTKTMGFSQSDKPVFEKYRREGSEYSEEPAKDNKFDGINERIGELQAQIDEMNKQIDYLKERRKGRNDEHNGNVKSN